MSESGDAADVAFFIYTSKQCLIEKIDVFHLLFIQSREKSNLISCQSSRMLDLIV